MMWNEGIVSVVITQQYVELTTCSRTLLLAPMLPGLKYVIPMDNLGSRHGAIVARLFVI